MVAYALAASALLWLLSTTDLAAVRATLGAIGPLALLVLAPLGLQVTLEALSWRMLLGRLGHPVGLGTAWRVNVQAEAVRLSFPGGPPVAEAMRPMLFARLRSVALPDAASALVVRKLCHLSTQGVFLGLGVLFGSALFARWAERLGPAGRILPVLSGAVALGLVAAGTFIGLVLSYGSVASRVERFLSRSGPGRLASFLERRRAGFVTLDSRLRTLLWHSPGALAWNLLTGLGGWLLDAAETLLVLRLAGYAIGPGEALGVEALVAVVRSGAFAVPGGLGIQDLTYHTLLVGTVSDAASMSLIVLKRARDVFWVIIGYLLPLLLDRLGVPRGRLGASSPGGDGG